LRERDRFELDLWRKSNIILPLETFWLDGSNGGHFCEVLPVLGPHIIHDEDSLVTAAYKDPGRPWRLCSQIAEAI
jgi:hypothetical protein